VNGTIDQYNGQQINHRLLFYTLCLVNGVTGIAMILPTATLPLLIEHTHISLDLAGWIFASFSTGTLLNAITLGTFSNRINPKYLLLSGMGIFSTTSLIVAWTHIFSVLLIAQFFAGIAFGFIYVSLNMLTALFFLETLSEVLNKLQSAAGIGALLAPLFLSFALQTLHEPIWAFCVVTILAWVTIGCLIPIHVPVATAQSKTLQKSTVPSTHIFKQVVFWLSILQIFFFLGAEVGFANWIVTVVSKETGVILAIAAPAATLFWLGLTSGSILSAQLLQRDAVSERLLLYCCFFGGCLSGLLVVIFPGNIWTSFAASLLMGLFLGPIFPTIMAITSRYFVKRLGFISSAMSFGGETAAFLCPTLMGIIIAHFGASWGMLLPALLCLLIAVPFSLAWWWQTRENGDVSQNAPFPLDDLMRKQGSIPGRVISGSLES